MIYQEGFDKKEPRYTYRVDKIDFKKRKAFVFRESSMDVDVPKGKWIDFKLISRVFPATINSCICNFSEFDGYYEFSEDWHVFILHVQNTKDFTITSEIPTENQLQPSLAGLSHHSVSNMDKYPLLETIEMVSF